MTSETPIEKPSEVSATSSISESYPMEGIKHPGINDVMFGRGGDTNYHIGNHRFRVLADEHRREYRSSSRKEKALVVQEVVRVWRARGGRFLTRTDPDKGDESLWHDVGDGVARKKAAKILSEKAPEEKASKGGAKSKGRKRPAVDSLLMDQASKKPAVTGAPVGSQPSLANAASTAISTPGAAISLLQQSAPLQAAAVSLAQANIQQPLQLAGAAASSSSLIARDLLGLHRANPSSLSALSAAAGLGASGSDASRLSLAAQLVVAQQDQEAARARILLANSLLLDNIRTTQNANPLLGTLLRANTTPNLLAALLNSNDGLSRAVSASTASSLINATRLGVTTDQLVMLLAATNRTSGEEHKTNDESNSSAKQRSNQS